MSVQTAPSVTPAEAANAPLREAVALFLLIDLLFLPRITGAFSTPISLWLLLVFLCFQRVRRRDLFTLTVFSVIVLASILSSAGGKNSSDLVENLKRGVQLVSILLYGIAGPALVWKVNKVVWILRAFFIYVFFTTALFHLQPSTYAMAIRLFFPEAVELIDFNILFARFPYIFTDPNSAGYLVALAFCAYAALEKGSVWLSISTTAAIVCVASTQSRGAYLALAIGLAGFFMNRSSKIRPSVKVALGLAVALMLWFLLDKFWETAVNLEHAFRERFEQESDLGGGRMGKYLYMIEHLNVLPYGSGYNLYRGGDVFRPHSDLIRLNLSYGFLAVPLFLYIIAPTRPNQLILFLAALVPFLINSLMDDYRLLGTYFVFVAAIAHGIDQGPKQFPAPGYRRA